MATSGWVRDETAKAELRKQVGDIGLILLVYSTIFMSIYSPIA